MRIRTMRLFGMIALILLYGFVFQGCSGSQQDQEDLEVSNQEEQQQDDDQQDDDQQYQDQEGQDQDQEGNEEDVQNLGADNLGEQGVQVANQTESNLQEIIQEMNGQQEETELVEATGDSMEAQMVADAPMPEAAPTQAVQGSSNGAIPFQPGSTPAGQGLPEMGSKMPYIVQAGDTMGKISSKVYGSPAKWKEMADLSGMRDPSRIYPGDVVYYTLDESSLAFATAYEATPRMQEQVQPGDTLASISRRVYGTSRAWKSIWRQNDVIENPDVVSPGTVVYYMQNSGLAQAIEKAQLELAKSAENLKNLLTIVDSPNMDKTLDGSSDAEKPVTPTVTYKSVSTAAVNAVSSTI